MKKHLLLITVLMSGMGCLFAQSRISIGVETALRYEINSPNIGIGGSLAYEAPITGKLSWIVNAGYISFNRINSTDFGGNTVLFHYNTKLIPIQAGVKYYFIRGSNGPYVGAQLGTHLIHNEYIQAGENMFQDRFDFSFTPTVGFGLKRFDLSLRYQQMISSGGEITNYLGARLSYSLWVSKK